MACAEESGWTRVRCCPPEIAPPAEEIAPPAEEIAPPPLREPPLTPATAPGEGGADLGGVVRVRVRANPNPNPNPSPARGALT